MSEKWKIPAFIRMAAWLGLEKEQSAWIDREDEGQISVVAEVVSFMFGGAIYLFLIRLSLEI